MILSNEEDDGGVKQGMMMSPKEKRFASTANL